MFAWNGGPTGPSNLVHLELMGPRRRVDNHVVDNAETLLVDSDLVFYDPIETGFSRPEKPATSTLAYGARTSRAIAMRSLAVNIGRLLSLSGPSSTLAMS